MMHTIFGDEETKTKYCRKCDTHQPIVSFRVRKEGRRDGGRLYTYCMPCEKRINKELSDNRKKSPPKTSGCECCGKLGVALVLDHDHTSGKIRGWLCQACNVGIGRLGDTTASVRNALLYLEKFDHG